MRRQIFMRYLAIALISALFIFPFIKVLTPLPERPVEYYTEDGTGIQLYIPSLKDFVTFFLTCMIALWISGKMAQDEKDHEAFEKWRKEKG